MNSTNVANVHLHSQVDSHAEAHHPANDNTIPPADAPIIKALGYAPDPAEVLDLMAQVEAAELPVDGRGIDAIREALDGGLMTAARAYAELIQAVRVPAIKSMMSLLDTLYDQSDVLEIRLLSPCSAWAASRCGQLGDPEQRKSLVTFLAEEFGGCNLYVGVNPRAEELAGTSRAGKAPDAARRRHVVLDLDFKDAPAIDPDWERTVGAFRELGPVLVNRSGNGWHCWFRIETQNGEAVATTTPILEDAMRAIGADNMADPPRIIRLPYSINIPTKNKRERGCALALCVPAPTDTSKARVWQVDALAAALNDLARDTGLEGRQTKATKRGSAAAASNAASSRGASASDLQSAPDKAALLELLARLPNDSQEYTREWQVAVAHAVRGAVKGTSFDDVEVREAFLDFSARYPGANRGEDAALYDGIRSPGTSWPHLVEMLESTDPEGAQRARGQAARAAFSGAPIDPSLAAMLAAMPPVEEPGVPEWAARLNKRFAYVMALDRVIEIDPATGEIIDRHTLQAFRTFHDGREQLQNDSGGRAVGLGSTWLKSRYARRYERTGMWPLGQEPAGVLNVWRGLPKHTAWPVVPAGNPVSDPLVCVLEFVNDTIASGRADVADHVLNWMAWKVQHPLDATGTTLALIGRQGTGKTTLAEMLIDIFGPRNAVTASNERQMVGNFNAHFEDKLVAVFEEAFLGRDPRMAGPFKDLVTGARLHIEAKGRDVRDVPNRLAIVLTSNDASVVPLEPNDRRTTLIRVSGVHRADNAYFDALRTAWTNGGREAFIDFLLTRDIEGFDPRRPLNTPEKAQALAETGDPVVRFWGQLLDAGEPVAPWAPNGGRQDWESGGVFMSTKDLYEAFEERSRRNGARYLPSAAEFNRRIEELCPSRREARRRVHGPQQNGPRGHDYPPLDQCRADFTRAASTGA